MRSLLFLFSLRFISGVFCQDTIQINLSFTGALFNHGRIDPSCKGKLLFEKPSDTSFLSISTLFHSPFMEAKGCTDFYYVKKNVPNGFYKIYIDSFLYETFSLKENERIGVSTLYNLSFSRLSDTRHKRKKLLKRKHCRLYFYKTETSIIDGVTEEKNHEWTEKIDDLSTYTVKHLVKSKYEIRKKIRASLSKEESLNWMNEKNL